ncbi:MAG: hypothetical protein CMK59_05210 [Proteobacteria bacterium]|nr:hypothetical protein [Pseudomonadota bacterium]
MRVPLPGLLRLDRQDLLNDVRERLAEKYPDYKDESEYDATDPAWIILEQSAWLVELLSEQLDRYPYSMVQEFVHMLGGSLNPSLPSIGVALVQPSESGIMEVSESRPSPWRFFTLQSEEFDMIEFASVERSVSLRAASIQSMVEVIAGELFLNGSSKGELGIETQEGWRRGQKASRIFDQEWVRYDLVSANAEDLLETLNLAIEALNDRKIGWLELRAEVNTAESVSVYARINLSQPFAHFHPGGLTDGTDVRGHWGVLDDSNWTPPVEIAHNPTLPLRLRGSRPMPGLRRGTIVIPNVPKNFNTDNLLQRLSMPIPTSVVEAIWVTLTHMDQKLAAYTPSISRGVELQEAREEPSWIGPALDGGSWSDLVNFSEQRFVHVSLQDQGNTDQLRVALVLKSTSEDHLPEVLFYGMDDERLQKTPLRHSVAWRIKLPDPKGGQRMVLVVAYDVKVGSEHNQLLLATGASPLAIFLNALLVINAPAVNDGRQLDVQRNIPEPINLLFDDIINEDVIEHLLRDNIPSDSGKLLKKLPLANFSVSGGADIQDFKGVWIDPTSPSGEGALIRINAPDRYGEQRQLRPGKAVTLNWYRRTDGAFGNVPAGAIQVIEQPPRSKPLILSVHNPLATFFGASRESEIEAIDRMFTSGGVPVLPSDWERLIRVSLGVRARGWMVRCWGHSERSLVSTALWPVHPKDPQLEREQLRLQRAIDNAGPEVLLVVLGPTKGVVDTEDLDWARGVIQGLVRKEQERLPLIKDIIVTRFYPLTQETLQEELSTALPSFALDHMRDGVLKDPQGRRAAAPMGRILLNGALVAQETVSFLSLKEEDSGFLDG